MFKRDQIDNIALGLISIFLLFVVAVLVFDLAYRKAQNELRTQHTANHYQPHAKGQIHFLCDSQPTAPRAVECTIEKQSTAQDTYNAQRDLGAQESMAEWTFWMAIFGALTVFLTAIGVWFIWRTLIATQKTVDVTSEIGEAQSRAYMVVSDIDIVIENNKPNRLAAKLVAKNLGATPAFDVKINSSVKYVLANGNTAFDSYEFPEYSLPPELPNPSITIVGQGLDTTNVIWCNDIPNIISAREAIANVKSGIAAVVVFGRIDYVDTFKKPRFTRFQEVCYKRGLEMDMKFMATKVGNYHQ